MKKKFSYFLIPMVLFSLVGCFQEDNNDGDSGTFESKTFIYDGTEKELTYGGLEKGQRAEYENNKAIEQGKYKATCKIYDKDNKLVDTLYAIMTIDYPDNSYFEVYLNQMFQAFLGNDYVSWNIFTQDPASFGLYRYPSDEAAWYTYVPVEPNEKELVYENMVYLKQMLESFKTERLSYNQQISYTVIEEFLNENITYYSPESICDERTQLRYVDSFGGYAADFVTYMEAYTIRTEQDIIDILNYTKSLPDAFASYPLYVQDRIEAGYPLSDYTLDEMISYLNNVIDAKDGYYLVDLLQDKVNACEALTDSAKSTYCTQLETYFENYFFTAHESLASSLVNYKGNCSSSQLGYLSAYGEVGKAEYVFQLRSNLGLPELDMDAYNAYLDEQIKKYENKLTIAINKLNRLTTSEYNVFNGFVNIGTSAVGITEPEDMIPYLKDFAKTIVPELSVQPDIRIKYMDTASAENSNALAYYMKSALDNDEVEYITLNPLTALTNTNDTLATMAHEGYPGHMYAYMYSKQLDISPVAKILSNLTHGEGWATYVQTKLYEYIKDNHNYPNADKAVEAYCDYMIAQDALAYLAYTKIDHMIHYEHKSVGAVSSFLGSIGFNSGAAQDIYNTLIEMPGNYAAYGFGRVFFIDLHDSAKAALGKAYNEIEFNAALLSHGWCSLTELIKIYEEYVDHTAFLNGIDLSATE